MVGPVAHQTWCAALLSRVSCPVRLCNLSRMPSCQVSFRRFAEIASPSNRPLRAKGGRSKHVWSIRVRLEIAGSRRDLAIFNLAIDSKLRACDLVKLRLDDICSGFKVRHRATIVQKKTGRPVQFEISEQSRNSVEAWLPMLRTTGARFLGASRLRASPHISTRQYARRCIAGVESPGLETVLYGTHSMRRTKACQIHRKTGNLRAVQLLPRPHKAREHSSIPRHKGG